MLFLIPGFPSEGNSKAQPSKKRLRFFNCKMEVASKIKRVKWKFTIGWIAFAVCLISLLIYGLSFFVSEPTIETITTNAAATSSNSNNADLMHDAKFQLKEKFRRH